jgi:uncharacterized membrane protein
MDKTRFIILAMYGLCGCAALLAGLPSYAAQNASITMMLVLLILAYIVRMNAKLDSLKYHHFTFIIRTIWIYSLFAGIGILCASWIIYRNGDASAIDALIGQIESGIPPSQQDIEVAGQSYMDTNMDLILRSMMLWMFPALLYMIWRVTRGSMRAYKNYRVQNIYSWF